MTLLDAMRGGLIVSVQAWPGSALDDPHVIAAMACAIWGRDWSWLGEALIGRIAAAPDDIAVVAAEADGDVVSDTEITTLVPAGATSGPVQVTTPNGTLTSNLPFRVSQ